ncbi:Integrase core domain [Popillia japonica]
MPSRVHNVRQFLGLTSYFRRFIKDYAIKSKHMTLLLRKDCEWSWNKEQEDAFVALKESMANQPVLALYSPHQRTELHTDASAIGLGGILLQEQRDGCLHPVMYASRQTTPEESRYHSTELEALAVVWATERFRPYLIGIRFKIVTDCSAVRTTFNKRDLVPRIGRWWLKMTEYDFEIEHRPGTMMKHADALSRNPVDDNSNTEVAEGVDILTIDVEDWIILAQKTDPQLQPIIDVLTQRAAKLDREQERIHQEYVLREGRLYKKQGNQLLLVVPKKMRWRIVKLYHDDRAHPATDNTVHGILTKFWFARLRNYVKGYIGACPQCLFNKVPGGKKQGMLHSIDKIGIPYHTVHFDHLGPFVKSKKGNSYVLAAIDGFTKHVMLRAVPNTKSETTCRLLREIIDLFGPPWRVITDRGTAFTGNAFRRLCAQHNINHVRNATATPRANGQVERLNRTLVTAIASMTSDPEGREWDKVMGQVQFSLNNTVHKATGTTPFRLMFNFQPRGYTGQQLQDEVDEYVREETSDLRKRAIDNIRQDQVRQRLPDLRKRAIDNIRQDQVRQRLRYNKRRCNSDTLAEGDLVLLRREASATGEPRKLLEKYKGPYVIIESLPGDRFQIADVPETQRTQRFYKGIASRDALKPSRDALKRYHPYNDTEDSETSSDDSGDMICDKAEYSARSDQKSVDSGNMISEKAEYSARNRQSDVDNEIGENSETKQDEYPTREKVTRRQRTIKRPQRYLD